MDYNSMTEEELADALNSLTGNDLAVALDSLTKEKLIALVTNIKKRRAFTYEDQMKLVILDSSRFTVWCSDRNCIIRFWSGQCQSLYGYTAEEAIGQDFVNLFVAEHERLAAREDQKKIIFDDEVFHNIANDEGRNGNILQLITNCRRITDPKTGEYWNAEMGLIIDNLEKERERLKVIVEESRKVKECVEQFRADAQDDKVRFSDVIRSIKLLIAECDKKAIELRKRTEFKKDCVEVEKKLKDLNKKFSESFETCLSKMQSCASLSDCRKVRGDFSDALEHFFEDLKDCEGDVCELSLKYESDPEKDLIKEKDHLKNDISSKIRTLHARADKIKEYYEKETDDFEVSVSDAPNSPERRKIISKSKSAAQIVSSIDDMESSYPSQIDEVSNKDELADLENVFQQKMNDLDKKISELELERR